MDNYLKVTSQVNYLKEQGLVFDDMCEEEAIRKLSKFSYYHKITGYKHYFSKFKYNKDGTDDYDGLDFNDLYEYHNMDRQLREILNDIVLEVEELFKVFIMDFIDTHLSDKSVFYYYHVYDVEKKMKLSSRVEKRAKDYDDPYSKKMMKKFPNRKPIWVANEYIYFSEAIDLFVELCKEQNIKEYNQLIHHLRHAKNIRNICAHNNHLFFSRQIPHNLCMELKQEMHEKFQINIKETRIKDSFTYDIISSIVAYKILAPKEVYESRSEQLFFKLHHLIKNEQVFKKYPDEKVTRDIKYIYKIVNQLY